MSDRLKLSMDIAWQCGIGGHEDCEGDDLRSAICVLASEVMRFRLKENKDHSQGIVEGLEMAARIADAWCKEAFLQVGCDGKHHGRGTEDCPRELHHHHDARCLGPGGEIRAQIEKEKQGI